MIFSVHRRELMAQTSRAFDKMDIPHGFIAAGEDYDSAQLVHIASIDTLQRRLKDVLPPDLLIIDESHRAMAEGWKKVILHWPDAKKVLITATPERLDGKGLRHVAQALVCGVTPKELIEDGYLSPYKIFAPNQPNLSKVKTIGGDYAIDALAAAMDDSKITGDAVEHYKSIVPICRRLCLQ